MSNNYPRSPVALIRTPEDLAEACAHLAQHPVLAFDTEFIGETSYQPELCLVQVASPERVELIDPLALKSLDPLWNLLADPQIVKICHAGDQDLSIAFHHGRKKPVNVFDTQLAGGLLGLGYPLAYWRLVELYCGVELDKAHTYSQWNRRPLSREQFEYAVDDVKYLPRIYDRMRERLEQLGHLGWMEQANAELCDKSAAPVDARAAYVRIKGANTLEPIQQAVLREVAAWREQLAFEHNLPVRAMLKDEVVFDLASRMPNDESGLLRIKNLPREEVVSYGDQLLAAIRRGRSLPADQRPNLPPPPDDSLAVKQLSEVLWAAAQAICLGQSVTPGLVCSQAEIAALARLLAEGQPLDTHPLMTGWHGECLGQKLVAFARGQSKMTLRVHDGLVAEFHADS